MVRGSTSDGNGLIQITWHGRGPAPMTLTADAAKIEPNQRTALAVHMPVLATGIVGFYDQAQPGTDKGIGTAPIIDGEATLTTPTRPLLPGDNTIHASYLGNTQYAANDSNTVIVAVRKPPATMRLTAYPTHIEPGQAPALIVEMPFDATGEIGFYDQAQPGTDKGIGVARIVHGLAILTTPYRPLLPGDNVIHASYLGDERYAANDSNTVTVRLSQPMHR